MDPLRSAMSYFFRVPRHDCRRMPLRRARGNRKQRRASLLLEQMEDRAVLAASISIADATIKEQGNLTVFASEDPSTIQRPSRLVFGPDRNNDGAPDFYVLQGDSKIITVYDGNTGTSVELFADSSSGKILSARLTFGADGGDEEAVLAELRCRVAGAVGDPEGVLEMRAGFLRRGAAGVRAPRQRRKLRTWSWRKAG